MLGDTPKRPLSVLIVEDEPDLRDAVSEAIEQAGYHFVGVGDLVQARAALATSTFDLVLLDVFVEGETCDQLLSELSTQQSPPATVLTSADITALSRGIAQRFDLPLVLKPFDLDDLMTTLGHAHEQRRVPARG
jgi:DNA-binding NtrC family response regulator